MFNTVMDIIQFLLGLAILYVVMHVLYILISNGLTIRGKNYWKNKHRRERRRRLKGFSSPLPEVLVKAATDSSLSGPVNEPGINRKENMHE